MFQKLSKDDRQPVATGPKKIRLSPQQAKLAEHSFRHLVVTLRQAETIAAVMADPEAWINIQHDLGLAVKRGDEITLVSHDGAQIADRCRVTRAEGGRLWLSKPLRLVQLEDVGLYDDGAHRVVPVGTGFSIQSCRDGHTGEMVFRSEAAAKNEILRRKPTRAA